ncbi:MAG: hypothetical protein GKR89_14565 [Candidatus Latescibacteria bacterium]|nr:hypothetical protein [Candidatus Latescibacterota bacterium]
MLITSVDIWTVVVPAWPDRVNSPEWVPKVGWDTLSKHIIRVNTDTEFYGLGETLRGVASEDVRAGAHRLLGRDPESIPLQNVFEERTDGEEEWLETGAGQVYPAFEMALFDLIGRLRQMPVHQLLGGAVRDRVRTDYWMGQQTPQDSQRTVRRALEQGFKGIKIKCKIEDPMVERLAAILEVGGPDFKVTVDPNQRFRTAEQTIALAAELEKLGNVEVFEDPIPQADLDGYRQIHAAINIPLAMHLREGPAIIRAVQAGVVDCVNLAGGLVRFVKMAAVAEAAGLRCWHGSGVDLGITEHSYLHAASVAPNCTMASDMVGSWVRQDDLIKEGLVFVDGFAPTPMAPGLGCELDEPALERYRQGHEQMA